MLAHFHPITAGTQDDHTSCLSWGPIKVSRGAASCKSRTNFVLDARCQQCSALTEAAPTALCTAWKICSRVVMTKIT